MSLRCYEIEFVFQIRIEKQQTQGKRIKIWIKIQIDYYNVLCYNTKCLIDTKIDLNRKVNGTMLTIKMISRKSSRPTATFTYISI